jgi:hypothetical protein
VCLVLSTTGLVGAGAPLRVKRKLKGKQHLLSNCELPLVHDENWRTAEKWNWKRNGIKI